LVSLAAADPRDIITTRLMADALAGLLSEITPVHREVIASTMTSQFGATGRIRYWALPPGLAGNPDACRKWAALALLDCVAWVGDRHTADYPVDERNGWKEVAQQYTQGAEYLPIQLPTQPGHEPVAFMTHNAPPVEQQPFATGSVWGD
jgi:hypothetical protein